MKFGHVNIVARNWKKLARFYERVLGCVPVPPERNLSGEWLEKATGIPGVRIQGIHLRLPGDEQGPTLEIFQYVESVSPSTKAINRQGLAHLAFRVDEIKDIAKKIITAGGRAVGELVTTEIKGAGRISFQYLTDPEGNIIELQKWDP